MLLELGLVGGVVAAVVAVGAIALARRKARPDPGAAGTALPPELAGRVRELEGLRRRTREVVEAHDLRGMLVGPLGQLDDLVRVYRQLAEETARQRAFLAENPRRGVEREVARLRSKHDAAGGPAREGVAGRLALAEQRLALVVKLDEAVAAARDRLGAIEEAARLIHGHAVAASAAGGQDLDVARVADDLAAADAALAEVRMLALSRQTLQ